MTDRQKKAQAAWAKAFADYRNAAPGERTRTREALRDAATEVLKADTEARKERRERRYAA